MDNLLWYTHLVEEEPFNAFFVNVPHDKQQMFPLPFYRIHLTLELAGTL